MEFCKALYSEGGFLKSLFEALTDDGVLVIQVGPSPDAVDPAEILGSSKNRALLIGHLERLGFVSMHLFHEVGNFRFSKSLTRSSNKKHPCLAQSHSGLFMPWNYLVAAKSLVSRKLWYRTEPEINLDIRRRVLPTKTGGSALQFFDGATMVSYQEPSKRFEHVFCRQEPMPDACEDMRGFDPSIPNAPIDWFEVKESQAGKNAGRGVFAKVDIPENYYTSVEIGVHPVYFPPSTFDLVTAMEASVGEDLEAIEVYMHGYGYQSSQNVRCE